MSFAQGMLLAGITTANCGRNIVAVATGVLMVLLGLAFMVIDFYVEWKREPRFPE